MELVKKNGEAINCWQGWERPKKTINGRKDEVPWRSPSHGSGNRLLHLL